MNLLAHLYLAELTDTSEAGQILGDMVKGRLDGRFPAGIERGIRLHRAIDAYTDNHAVTAALRRRFQPPLRRYGGILIDIGFDYCLARDWADYHSTALPAFAEQAVARARRQWPAEARAAAKPPMVLSRVLVDYRQSRGLQHALDSVDRRLSRASPVADALPVLLAESEHLAAGFRTFFPDLCDYSRQVATDLT